MFRIEDTISSQYANSPRLMLIIQELHNAIDPTKNIQDFYHIMWNLETAQGVGLGAGHRAGAGDLVRRGHRVAPQCHGRAARGVVVAGGLNR